MLFSSLSSETSVAAVYAVVEQHPGLTGGCPDLLIFTLALRCPCGVLTFFLPYLTSGILGNYAIFNQ
jgi:hypothetical protein